MLFGGDFKITLIGEERVGLLLLITRDSVVSLLKSFLFLCVLEKGCVIFIMTFPGPSV